jgi:hypothetical protein
MSFFPPLFLSHCLFLALGIAAVASPVFDALTKKRLSGWLIAIVVFYLVAFGIYGVEEMFFREVWPSYIPFISLALGVLISVAHRTVVMFRDRKARGRGRQKSQVAETDIDRGRSDSAG